MITSPSWLQCYPMLHVWTSEFIRLPGLDPTLARLCHLVTLNMTMSVTMPPLTSLVICETTAALARLEEVTVEPLTLAARAYYSSMSSSSSFSVELFVCLFV
eukprot:scpid105195/ scgid32885/ 